MEVHRVHSLKGFEDLTQFVKAAVTVKGHTDALVYILPFNSKSCAHNIFDGSVSYVFKLFSYLPHSVCFL